MSETSRKLSENRRSHESLDQHLDKCAELFEHAKHLTKPSDKTTEQVEFERGQQECTFKPSISHAPPHIPKPQRHPEDARSHIERLNRAREERQRVREITERGYSSKRSQERSQARKPSP